MSEAKRAPCIDVRTDVHKDERFAVLGDLGGYNRHEALGRMHWLWSWCRDRGLQDTRAGMDGYVVHEAIVRRFLGPNGVNAILGDGIDEFALAVELEDGMLYLRGTSEYVAAARAHRATSSAGGKARQHGPRDDAGRFAPGSSDTPSTRVIETTNVQPEHQPASTSGPAVEPPAAQPNPASSSFLFPLPSSQDQNTHATRAIGAYDPDSTEDRNALTLATYTRVATARAEAIAKHRLTAIPMPAVRAGMPSEPVGVRDLRDRIRAEGDAAPQACEQIAATLIREADETKSVEWLSEKAFTEGGWRHARNGGGNRSRAAAQPPRASAIGSATPRRDHGTDMKPAKEVM